MSSYRFISCNDVLPELLSDKKRLPNGELKIYYDNSNDAGDLEITRTPSEKAPYDIKYYTDHRYIYEIEGERSDENCSKLVDYLKSLQIPGSIELWYVWLCNLNDIPEELRKLKVYQCNRRDINGNLLSKFLKSYGNCGLPKVLKLL
jgi:hypothetical protein